MSNKLINFTREADEKREKCGCVCFEFQVQFRLNILEIKPISISNKNVKGFIKTIS